MLVDSRTYAARLPGGAFRIFKTICNWLQRCAILLPMCHSPLGGQQRSQPAFLIFVSHLGSGFGCPNTPPLKLAMQLQFRGTSHAHQSKTAFRKHMHMASAPAAEAVVLQKIESWPANAALALRSTEAAAACARVTFGEHDQDTEGKKSAACIAGKEYRTKRTRCVCCVLGIESRQRRDDDDVMTVMTVVMIFGEKNARGAAEKVMDTTQV